MEINGINKALKRAMSNRACILACLVALVCMCIAISGLAFADSYGPTISIVMPDNNSTLSKTTPSTGVANVVVMVWDPDGLPSTPLTHSIDGGAFDSTGISLCDKRTATLCKGDSNCKVYVYNWDIGGYTDGTTHTIVFRGTDGTNTTGTGTGDRSLTIKVQRALGGDAKLLARGTSSFLCMSCHGEITAHSSMAADTSYGNWQAVCLDCHTPHGTTNLYLIRQEIDTPNSGLRTVNLRKPTTVVNGPGGYVNGSAGLATQGICQVCHTQTGGGTSRWRNTGNESDHYYDFVCADCHSHEAGFIFMHEGGVVRSCVNCHGHDEGTLYDPDGKAPYTPGTRESRGMGTTHSHSTHTELDSDDPRGPGIYCDDCHAIDNMPYFINGADDEDDGSYSLSETHVCDGCHSPGGSYDGVNDPVIGAKNNWASGVYVVDDLKPGKEKWCATCHDEEPSLISLVNAPNVIGNETEPYIYGTGWGFYKTGHGLPKTQTIPSSGGITDGPGVVCTDCHDSATAHIDGEPRTYDDGDSYNTDPSVYRIGYRLRQVDTATGAGASTKEPMRVPWKQNIANDPDNYRLCANCHDPGPFYQTGNMNTNMITDGVNRHAYHMNLNSYRYPSDWSGASNSRATCVICHNVHGSGRLAMIRNGILIDREPGLKIWYKNDAITTNLYTTEPPEPQDIPLSASDGTVWQGGSSGNLCTHCHGNNNSTPENRTPFQDTGQVPTLDWTAETGYVTDGVNPDSSYSGSMFTFRVEYTDTNDDAPVSPDYVSLLIDTDNDGTANDTYIMNSVDAGDVIYLNGKLYTKSVALTNAASSVIRYKFAANDGIYNATGAPTNWSTVRLLNDPEPPSENRPPFLEFVEAYCTHEGVNPWREVAGEDFTFTVEYSDLDGDCPDGNVQVIINGTSYDLTGSCSDGSGIYNGTIALTPAGNYSYLFNATDGTDTAIGPPTEEHTVTVLDSGVIRVNPAGDYGYSTIQSGVDEALDNTYDTVQVLVYDGTYTENLNLWYWDYSNTEILSVCGPDSAIINSVGGNAVFLQNISGIVIDGFGITNATTGINSNAGVATISSCKIYDNHNTVGGGGGIYSGNASGILTVIDSAIYNNTALTDGAGVTYNAGYGYSFTNTIITNNTASGGGGAMFTQNGSVEFVNSTITDNTASGSGGAIYSNGSKVYFHGTTITGNTSTGGNSGVIYLPQSSAHAYIYNSVVANNRSNEGGVSFVNTGAKFTAINSTFADNEATTNGGFIRNQNGTVIIENSILWNNTAGTCGHITCFNGGTMSITNAVLSSGHDGIYTNLPYFDGNRTPTLSGYLSENDPMFVDADSGDYHIQAISDAIDHAGTLPGVDIDGDTRPQGSACDIGADEYAASTDAPVLAWTGESGYTEDGVDPDSDLGGNPFEFRVEYSDADGDAPELIELWIDENLDGAYGPSEKYAMSLASSIDFVNGTIYNATQSLMCPAGECSLSYRFYATDGTREAGGEGCSEAEVTVTNNPPTISWPEDAGYSDNGVNPDSGAGGTNFEFRVDYDDVESTSPDPIEVWVDRDDSGDYSEFEKLDMSFLYNATYIANTTIPYVGDGTIDYRFYASDGIADATGDPVDGEQLTVTDPATSAPTLSWTAASCLTDGVRPPRGGNNADFEFRVVYTSDDNPCTGNEEVYVWVDEDDSSTYDPDEKYMLEEVNPSDTDCTDGKEFELAHALSGGGDGVLNYRFYATDGYKTATGEPAVTDSPVTVYEALKVGDTTGAGWYSTIQGAVDISTDPSTIVVYPNTDFTAKTYSEGVSVMTKSNRTIISACGLDLTTISATGSDAVLFQDGTNNVLEGFTITNATSSGVNILRGDNGVIRDVNIHDNLTGITANDTQPVTIENAEIYQNDRRGIVTYVDTDISIYNSTFYRNNEYGDYAASGAGLYLDGGTNILTNVSITNSTAVGDAPNGWGGGMYIQGGNTIITNATVTNNNSQRGGGGIYHNNGTISITDSAISINNAGTSGGGLVLMGSDEGSTITNTTFADNTFGGDGAIYTNGAIVQFVDCNITGNIGDDFGGGMFIQGGTTFFTNATITNNSAARSGGGLYVNSGTISMDDSTVSINNAGTSGGGMLLIGSDDSVITNTVFANNTSNYYNGGGGAIYMNGGNVQCDNCDITGNSAAGSGGGMYLQTPDTVFTNATITDNNSGRSGGGIYQNHGIMNMVDSTVSINNATSGGGGILFLGSVEGTAVTNTAFTNNTADDGGAFYMNGGNLQGEDCDITGNSAGDQGGGVYLSYANAAFTNAAINNNDAANSGGGIYMNGGTLGLEYSTVSINNAGNGGGGILFFNTAAGTAITNTTISGNTAADGGAFFLNQANVLCHNCYITENEAIDDSATSLGGAIYVTAGSADYDQEYVNCVIADNAADKGGAVYVNSYTNLTFTNVTFAENEAESEPPVAANTGGAFDVCTSGNLDVRNSIFWDNEAASGGHNIYKHCGGSDGYMTITDSDITDGTGYIDGDATVAITNSIVPAQDPQFAGEHDYHLTATSPVINGASADYAPDDDIDGDTRPYDGADDMGADEYVP